MSQLDWKYRWAPSLGELEDTPENIWGIEKYESEIHKENPVVFCGLYGLPDFYALWRHPERKAIWWTGSDIRHFRAGYWLDKNGNIKLRPKELAKWIETYCESWCENDVEYEALKKLGISSKVCPSFLGDVKKYEVDFKPAPFGQRSKLYTSVSGNDFEVYGWKKIDWISDVYKDVEFHLYGNTVESPVKKRDNVFIHGRVSKEVFNQETDSMQGGLRLTSFDGFSEVLARSILRGQWPVSLIEYPHMLKIDEIDKLKTKFSPNFEGRNYYLGILNHYPWNMRKSDII